MARTVVLNEFKLNEKYDCNQPDDELELLTLRKIDVQEKGSSVNSYGNRS